MKLKTKIYLEDDNGKFMGIGVLWLLNSIQRLGSLRAAAADLGISYSKAYSMVENLENALEHRIIERKRGGKDRVGACLTPFATSFLEIYDDFQKKCKVLLEKPFDEFMEEYVKLESDGEKQ
ncbi:MAG: LysR family transcriptional regulator [Sphaerochaetaceae bacterium]|nr:LysR family transcriptional regulator [Sphaerochaetaceae bacterium]